MSFQFNIQDGKSISRFISVDDSQHLVHPLNIERNYSIQVNKYFCHQCETQGLFTQPTVTIVKLIATSGELYVSDLRQVRQKNDA